jgi:guanylate kinase
MSSHQRLIVLSGPSGSGKATLLNYITTHTDIKRVVTYTTRKPRPGEVDGVDYHFVDWNTFDRMLRNGDLVEAERVYGDFYYGSPRDIFSGTDGDVIMELDTQGARNYRRHFDNILTIFILPPSISVLIDRIESRHKETNFRGRLRSAIPQLEAAKEYDYIVINDDIERVGAEIIDFLKTGRDDEKRPEKLALAQKLIRELAQ